MRKYLLAILTLFVITLLSFNVNIVSANNNNFDNTINDILNGIDENIIDKYNDKEEKLFGILIKKDSEEFVIGKTDVCNCSIDASFEKLEKTDSEFFKKIKEIIDGKIIY